MLQPPLLQVHAESLHIRFVSCLELSAFAVYKHSVPNIHSVSTLTHIHSRREKERQKERPQLRSPPCFIFWRLICLYYLPLCSFDYLVDFLFQLNFLPLSSLDYLHPQSLKVNWNLAINCLEVKPRNRSLVARMLVRIHTFSQCSNANLKWLQSFDQKRPLPTSPLFRNNEATDDPNPTNWKSMSV